MIIPVLRKEDAVSPVIGAILLIALTTVFFGIAGAVFIGVGAPEPVPAVGISIGSQGDIITVTHLNGAVLSAGNYKILVDGADKTAEFGGDADFGPGMKLRWDSGSEAVGTVSVIHLSEKGVSTLLAEKRIGKAGSGEGEGGEEEEEEKNIKILEIGGMKFDLSNYWGAEWTDVVKDAKNLSNGGDKITLTQHKIYYDGIDYWWVRENGLGLTKNEAGSNPSLNTFAANHPGYLVKIKRDRLLTYENVESIIFDMFVTFLDDAKPVDTGTLFTNGSNLYVWEKEDDASYFMFIFIIVPGWEKIGDKI